MRRDEHEEQQYTVFITILTQMQESLKRQGETLEDIHTFFRVEPERTPLPMRVDHMETMLLGVLAKQENFEKAMKDFNAATVNAKLSLREKLFIGVLALIVPIAQLVTGWLRPH